MDRDISLKKVKSIVVKVGTSSLTHDDGRIDEVAIKTLVENLSKLQDKGFDVILVSSGAIGAGIGKLGLSERPTTLPEKQATAAVGQLALIKTYDKYFSEYGKTIGQLLLTRDDFSDRKRFLNARNTCMTLLKNKVIPIVNENDSISTEEIKVGDNDTLSALVSGLVGSDLLIIMSDIDGLYDSDPRKNKDAKMIYEVPEITEEIRSMASGAGSALGTGGMATKIKAAEIATSKGTMMLIVNGENMNILGDIFSGGSIGTLFLKSPSPINSKKHWIKYSAVKDVKIIVDNGAVRALKDGKSLLATGIVDVDGDFIQGDPVAIYSNDLEYIATGIVNYSSKDIHKIKGCKSSEFERILGSFGYIEVSHSDNITRD